MMNSEPTAETSTNEEFQIYKRRWYMIGSYSLLAFYQCYLWNQWGPLFESVKLLFNFDEGQIARFPFYGTVLFTILVIPNVWLVERFGIRFNVCGMAVLVWLGCIIRCVPVDNISLQTWLINISAFVEGLASINAFFMPAALSARWFPPNERKLATATGVLLNLFGFSASFIIGPYAVPDPSDSSSSSRKHAETLYFHYTYMETAFASAICIMILAYFPSQPPKPPSPSAQEEKVANLQAIKELLIKKDFWIITIPAVLIFGSVIGWQCVLGICLQQNGVDQSHAGWIGCWSTLASLLSGVVLGKVADAFPRRLKAIIVAFTVITMEGSLWILLVTQNYMDFNLPSIYVAVILTGASSGALMPLYFELGAEVCFPSDEATVVGFMGCFLNLLNSIFLAVLFFPNVKTGWMTWWLAIACGIAAPWSIFLPTTYRRAQLDRFIPNDMQ